MTLKIAVPERFDAMNRLRTAERIPLYLSLAAFQFFVCEFLVAGSWRGTYSYSDNFISDLGVPYCGAQGTIPCSQSAVVMNASFVVLGMAIVVGAAWAYANKLGPAIAWLFLVVAGIGMVVAGIARSNTLWEAHSLGASLFFIFGGVSALTIGVSVWPETTSRARYAVIAFGVAALVAYFCYTYKWNLGLGTGGIERASAYSAILGYVSSVYLLNQLRIRPPTSGRHVGG